MTAFTGVTPDLLDEAFSLFSSTIHDLAERGIINKSAGVMTVLNPAIPYEPKYNMHLNPDPSGVTFDKVVLWEASVGDPDVYDLATDRGVSRSKAHLSFMTGLPSRLVRVQYPELYIPGMTKWAGSWVEGFGPMRLITSFSAGEEEADEMFAKWMAASTKMLCHRGAQALEQSDEDSIPWADFEAPITDEERRAIEAEQAGIRG